MIVDQYLHKPVKLLFVEHPYAEDWLGQICMLDDVDCTLHELVSRQKESFDPLQNMSARLLLEQLDDYLSAMKDLLKQPREEVKTMALLPGRDKDGRLENFDFLVFYPGEIVAIVGPTGSGKSRLLEDIECGADGNTPSKRRVLINDQQSYIRKKRRARQKIVAQLSQNMNFVVDLSVGDFLNMHARCWPSEGSGNKIARILELANSLSGEKFALEDNVAQLSGGQSRALMIADCALLSTAPIVLIDEIENAGINRRRALDLLTSEDKIVFLATHDPLLALLAQKRLVIKNGGIHRVVLRSKGEEETLKKLEFMDRQLLEMRARMRIGGALDDCKLSTGIIDSECAALKRNTAE
ncbi:MAG: ATP-binding cassette domain-containing protein [Dethiobacteria bacterium]|jgi:ABC-type lipoprotein export system ATPase subunit